MEAGEAPIDSDELAGITALHGALTRVELRRGATRLCHHRGRAVAAEAIEDAIDRALSTCALLVAPLAVDPPLDDAPIVTGPNASPTIPEAAPALLDDLDVEPRAIDHNAVREAADTELERYIKRAREGQTPVSVGELTALRAELADWMPVSIDPGLVEGDELPLNDDELAGIVEPFGALTRLELRQAASVLCYRRGVDAPDTVLEYAIDRALSSWALLVAPRAVTDPLDDAPIVVGPTASPASPPEFDDLAGLVGIDPRPIDPDAVREAAVSRYDRELQRTRATTGDGEAPTASSDGAIAGDGIVDEHVSMPTGTDIATTIESWEPTVLDSPVVGESDTAKGTPSADASDVPDDAPATATARSSQDSAKSAEPTDDSARPAESIDETLLLADPAALDGGGGLPLDGDELAGIVELFGALTRDEVRNAASELCYRRGVDAEPDPLDALVDRALAEFVLLSAPGAVDSLLDDVPLVAGPAAFPAHPEHAEDLPHILDIDARETDRDVVRDAAATQFRAAVDAASDDADTEPSTADRLLELCYDLETWGAIDLDAERSRLREIVDRADGEERSTE